MLVMPSSLVRVKRSSSLAAPSSMEYSVWTCRWTKSAPETEPDDMGGAGLLSEVQRSGTQEVEQAAGGAGLRGPGDQLGEERQPSRPPPTIVAGRTDNLGMGGRAPRRRPCPRRRVSLTQRLRPSDRGARA